MLSRIKPAAMAKPLGAYSHGVVVPEGARILYVAGQVGVRPDGQMEIKLADQIDRAFRNLALVLAESHMSLSDLVNINSYMLSTQHLEVFRDVRLRWLPDPPPASTVLIVAGLAHPDWLFELDAVAAQLVTPLNNS